MEHEEREELEGPGSQQGEQPADVAIAMPDMDGAGGVAGGGEEGAQPNPAKKRATAKKRGAEGENDAGSGEGGERGYQEASGRRTRDLDCPACRPRVAAGAAKSTPAVVRTWLRIEPNGESNVLQADKYKLTTKLGIQTRDLRLLDPHLATTYPSAILCRDKSIVVNLEHIKVTSAALRCAPPHGPV
jgi:hypothetical protein